MPENHSREILFRQTNLRLCIAAKSTKTSAGVSCWHNVSPQGGIKTGGRTSLFSPFHRTMACSIMRLLVKERNTLLVLSSVCCTKSNNLSQHAAVCREIVTLQITSAPAPHNTNSSTSSTETCTMGPSATPAGCPPCPSQALQTVEGLVQKGLKASFLRNT